MVRPPTPYTHTFVCVRILQIPFLMFLVVSCSLIPRYLLSFTMSKFRSLLAECANLFSFTAIAVPLVFLPLVLMYVLLFKF